MVAQENNIDKMARLIMEKTGSADADSIGIPHLPKSLIDSICKDRARRGSPTPALVPVRATTRDPRRTR